MKAKKYSYAPEYAAPKKAAIKTISLKVDMTEPNLNSTIQKAFNLAKSSGLELDLAFVPQPLARSNA